MNVLPRSLRSLPPGERISGLGAARRH